MLGFLIKTLAQGIAEQDRKDAAKKQWETLQARQDGIISALLEGHNLDDIADALENEGVARRLTLIYTAEIVRAMGAAEDPAWRGAAQRMMALQRIDSEIAPEQFLKQLNADKHVFLAGDCYGERAGSDPVKGIAILTLAYLYFLPYEPPLGYTSARVKGMASDALSRAVPGFGVLSTIWEIGSSINEGGQNYFQRHIDGLVESLSYSTAFALPLRHIRRIETFGENNVWWFGVHVREERQRFFFRTTSDSNSKEWAEGWADAVPLACIAEGVFFPKLKPRS
jgi:hypothetical protein